MKFASFSDFSIHLDTLGLFSMKMGLSRMEEALARLDLTTPSMTVAHVVGTNGKGSTSGFLDALARAHGLKTGLYTSPHLVSVRERIRVQGSPLSELRWVAAANRVVGACTDLGLTYFELLTVMACVIFSEESLDLVVLEAGLGGTYDATCAVPADLAVMTPVGLDHENVLGSTLELIARDKGGALGCCPAVTGIQERVVMDIFRTASGAQPLRALEECRTAGGYVVGGHGATFSLSSDLLPSHPPYQLENAGLAVLAWSMLVQGRGWQFDAALCTQALGRARFQGRFCRHGQTLVDGAHNGMGLTALCEALERRGERFGRLVFQSMQDKVLDPVLLKRLAALADEVVVPGLPGVERASAPETLASRFFPCARTSADLQTALECPGSVLICGSLYLVGAYYGLHPEYFDL